MTDRRSSLAQHFAELTDPRIDRSRLHDLLDIVTIAICAVVPRAESWDDTEHFGMVKSGWLETILAPPNGIPSRDTFRRLSERHDPDEFQRASLAGSRCCARRPNGRSLPSTARRCATPSIGLGDGGVASRPRLGGAPPLAGAGRREREIE